MEVCVCVWGGGGGGGGGGELKYARAHSVVKYLPYMNADCLFIVCRL